MQFFWGLSKLVATSLYDGALEIHGWISLDFSALKTRKYSLK
jgi:hypothetical protein